MKLLFSFCFLHLCIVAHSESIFPTKDSIPFLLEGHVEGLNGQKLTLILPSYKVNTNPTILVNNDTFVFQGKIADEAIVAKLMLTKDITDPTGIYSAFSLILSGKKTRISFVATKNQNQDLRYSFSNLQILEGLAAIEYDKYRRQLFKESTGGIVFKADSLYLDSLSKFVFPERRIKFEKLYSKIQDSIMYPYVKAKLLEELSKTPLYTNGKGARGESFLFIANQFQKIESALLKHTDYRYFKSYFNPSDKINKSVFKDFELESIKADTVKLSKIIASNKYTLLYFWWSGCSPCRGFIKNEQKNYSAIRSKGIEVVSINTDQVKWNWRNASKKDRISWINVYAGSVSPILFDYNIESYPTKIIFNNKFEIIEKKMNSLLDLLDLK